MEMNIGKNKIRRVININDLTHFISKQHAKIQSLFLIHSLYQ